jgi:hypothetical protein
MTEERRSRGSLVGMETRLEAGLPWGLGFDSHQVQ